MDRIAFCRSCGSELPWGTETCSRCGAPQTNGARVPSRAEEEAEARDRLRADKEREWAHARAMADAERGRQQRRERDQQARKLALRRQAAADALGTILTPSGAARGAMLKAIVIGLLGSWLAIAIHVLALLLWEDPQTVLLVQMVGMLVLLGCGIWAWYLWWVGVVGFVADKVGDSVEKRLVRHLGALRTGGASRHEGSPGAP